MASDDTFDEAETREDAHNMIDGMLDRSDLLAFCAEMHTRGPAVSFDRWYKLHVRMASAITEYGEAMGLEVDTIEKAYVVGGALLIDRRGSGDGPENRPPCVLVPTDGAPH